MVNDGALSLWGSRGAEGAREEGREKEGGRRVKSKIEKGGERDCKRGEN